MSDATDRPADMPPWIVDHFAVRGLVVTVWSDGDVQACDGVNGIRTLPRNEAIAMCKRILAILEGDDAKEGASRQSVSKPCRLCSRPIPNPWDLCLACHQQEVTEGDQPTPIT